MYCILIYFILFTYHICMLRSKKKVLHLEKDLFIVILLNLIGFAYAILFRNQFFGKDMYSYIVMGVPAMVYMFVRRKKNWKKILVFSVIIGGLYCFLLEFIAEFNHLWEIPYPALSYRIFGFLPIFDITIGHAYLAGYVATFYEHFVDATHISKRLSWRHVLAGTIPAVAALTFFLILYFINPNNVKFSSYLYVKIGIIAIIPPILFAIQRPSIFKKMALCGIYFFFFFLALEVLGVNLKFWTFGIPASYIGWVRLFNVSFPFEEIFFWMAFYSSFLIFFYEKYIDE